LQVRSKAFIIFFICFLFIPSPSQGSDQQSIITDQFEQLELDEVDTFLKKVDEDIYDQLSGISLAELFDDVRQGKLDLELSDIFNALLRYFCREFLTHTSLLGKLIILGALLALIEHLQNAFEQNTVAKLAHALGMLILLTVALSSFAIALNTGRDAIGNMVGFMQAMIPVIMTLMAAMGNLTTVALMQPVIFISSNILATLIQNIVFPLIFCAAVLSIVSSLSERFKVSRLADLIRDGSVLLVSLVLTNSSRNAGSLAPSDRTRTPAISGLISLINTGSSCPPETALSNTRFPSSLISVIVRFPPDLSTSSVVFVCSERFVAYRCSEPAAMVTVT
jgi:stage III sporulation protein AE